MSSETQWQQIDSRNQINDIDTIASKPKLGHEAWSYDNSFVDSMK